MFFLAAVILLSPASIGSDEIQANAGVREKSTFVILRVSDLNTPFYTPPPEASFMRLEVGATINVNFVGTWDTNAQAAFQYAVDIWETLICSDVIIKVDAYWTALDPGVLGSAGCKFVWRDFSGAPNPNTWYADALADKLHGSDLSPTDPDIIANFNSSYSNWYFGTDGSTPSGKADFVTVVMHEICHGLGFFGSMNVSGGVGSWGFGSGYPIIYDTFAINGSYQSLINTLIFPNPSVTLGTELTSNNVFFNGPKAVAAAGGSPPKLYAPVTWQGGSSYSHLDEMTYPAGNPNSMMTPYLNLAEAIHNPGPIIFGMFEDMSWTIASTDYFIEVIAGDFDSDGYNDDIAGLDDKGKVWYTTNLNTWTQIPGTLTKIICGDFNSDGYNNDIAGLNAKGRIWYTTNRSTWTLMPGTLEEIINGDFDSDGYNDDMAGLNAKGKVFYTTDLSTWTFIPGTLTEIINGDFNSDGYNDDIAGLNAKGKVFYTTNLSTWTLIQGI
jgi:hypothetical protein